MINYEVPDLQGNAELDTVWESTETVGKPARTAFENKRR